MPSHKDLAFESLHKSIAQSGLLADRPASPDGVGDMWWSTDTATLSLTNAAGDAWVDISVGSVSIVLNDLTDVDTTGVASGYVITYDGASWVAQAISLALNDLTDVDTTGVTDNDIIVYSGGTWAVLPYTFASLGDVATGITFAKGDIIVWDGTELQKLPVGTDSQSLVADSSTATGLKWGDASSQDAELYALLNI